MIVEELLKLRKHYLTDFRSEIKNYEVIAYLPIGKLKTIMIVCGGIYPCIELNDNSNRKKKKSDLEVENDYYEEEEITIRIMEEFKEAVIVNEELYRQFKRDTILKNLR